MGRGGIEWGGDVNAPSAMFPRPCTRCWCYAPMGWGGVGMLTFPRPGSVDLSQDVDATLTWGGVGCGGDVNVPSAKFPRPCARCWCYDHMGWGGDVLTCLRPCSLDLVQDVDARITWGVVGWHVNVLSTTFPRPFTRRWCYAHMGWGGVGMLTFLRPRSFDLAQDADAMGLGGGGVGWGNKC